MTLSVGCLIAALALLRHLLTFVKPITYDLSRIDQADKSKNVSVLFHGFERFYEASNMEAA